VAAGAAAGAAGACGATGAGRTAGAAVDGADTPPARKASTSFLVTRPPRPVPGMRAMSRPCSATMRATTGDMKLRPPSAPSPPFVAVGASAPP
jgi:hypothetical protein